LGEGAENLLGFSYAVNLEGLINGTRDPKVWCIKGIKIGDNEGERLGQALLRSKYCEKLVLSDNSMTLSAFQFIGNVELRELDPYQFIGIMQLKGGELKLFRE